MFDPAWCCPLTTGGCKVYAIQNLLTLKSLYADGHHHAGMEMPGMSLYLSKSIFLFIFKIYTLFENIKNKFMYFVYLF